MQLALWVWQSGSRSLHLSDMVVGLERYRGFSRSARPELYCAPDRLLVINLCIYLSP
jgi:hypothetical protein